MMPTAEYRGHLLFHFDSGHPTEAQVVQQIHEAEAVARLAGAKEALESCDGLMGLVEAWRDDAALVREDERMNLPVADVYDECADDLEATIRNLSEG